MTYYRYLLSIDLLILRNYIYADLQTLQICNVTYQLMMVLTTCELFIRQDEAFW